MAERVYQAARSRVLPDERIDDLLPALVVIAGPTGVGKTALSLEIARTFPVEVISADSRQVYRGDRKSTRLNSSHIPLSRMPSSA